MFGAHIAMLPALGCHEIPQLEEKIARAQNITQVFHEFDDEMKSRTKLQRVRSKLDYSRHGTGPMNSMSYWGVEDTR